MPATISSEFPHLTCTVPCPAPVLAPMIQDHVMRPLASVRLFPSPWASLALPAGGV